MVCAAFGLTALVFAVTDETPYNHYSLLRTFEDAFRLNGRLGHSGDTAKGVVPMVKLFAAP